MVGNQTSADLVAEADSKFASEIHKCATRCEDAGFELKHVNTRPATGVLLEAHDPESQTLTDDAVIMQIADGRVSVLTPTRDIKTESLQAACEAVLEDVNADD